MIWNRFCLRFDYANKANVSIIRYKDTLDREKQVASRAAVYGRAQLLAKSAHAGHLRLPAELLEVAENSGNSKGSEFGISEKCCILEKSRKNLVKFGENSAKFWQKLRNFGKKQQKIQQFLTKILRLESGSRLAVCAMHA